MGGWRLVVAALVAAVGQSATAGAVTFPGVAPCDTTLAACVAGATEGDVVQLATNGPIDESVTIEKSLSLEPAPGFSPQFAADRYVYVALLDPARTVAVRGLSFLDGYVRVDTSGTTSHSISVTDCNVAQPSGSTASRGIGFSLSSPATVIAERNVVTSDGYGVELLTYGGSGAITTSITSNRIRKATVGKSVAGIQLYMHGAFTITADVRSNVVSDVADCNCGASVAVYVGTGDTASATVNLVNNTIDLSPEPGINVLPPAVGQLLIANIFNNVVTRTLMAIDLPPANPRLTVNNGANDFFNNTGMPDFGGYAAGPGTLAVDPQFVSLVARDYHLQGTSLLVNAGEDASPGGLSSLDAEGNVRVAGPAVDIGAYEFGSAPPTTTSTTVTSPASTTTTLPGCTPETSTASVLCRLDVLAVAIQTGVPAGPLGTQLAAKLAGARDAVGRAAAATKARARKRALAAAIRAVGAIGRKLRSRKAKDLDANTKSALTASAADIQTALKTLKSQ